MTIKSVIIMKRVLLSILTLLLSVCVNAQTESTHLTFKGVPIDGTLNQFVSNMKVKGFTGDVKKDGTAILKGDFAGYKGCAIMVSTLQNKDLVSMISVVFPKHDTWGNLEGNYLKLKEMLTTKYGNPAEVIEESKDSYYSKDDNSKMTALFLDGCDYQTVFQIEKGVIVLKLFHGENYGSGHVILGYYDKINCVEVESAAMDDL